MRFFPPSLSGGVGGRLLLQPFNTIHESRYMMYWMNVDGEKWNSIRADLQAREDSLQRLAARTVDYVETGTQQSESDHYMEATASNHGSNQGEYWRDATGEFSYQLNLHGNTKGLALWMRYWGGDAHRTFDILVDGTLLTTVTTGDRVSSFHNEEYPLPEKLLRGKSAIRVTFRAHQGSVAGGVYYLRLVKLRTLKS